MSVFGRTAGSAAVSERTAPAITDRAVYLHTNIPAPYRRHQFEAISAVFPRSKAFFYERMHGDRRWNEDVSDWAIRCFRPRGRISLGRYGSLALGLVRHLLIQPSGTIHLVGACGASVYLLCLFGRIRGGTLVLWNDGGFSDSIGRRHERIFKTWLRPFFGAAFTPGLIGREYCQRLGFSTDETYNAFFSHDVELYDRLRRESGAEFRAAIRETLGIPPGDFVMLNVSRLLPLKRLEDLKDALVSLDGRCRGDAHIVFIGEGPHVAPLTEMKRKLSTIRVHHVPFVPYADLPAWYAAADLMVFTSERDIWGLVVNEALSMGVPVICTSCIGASELVRNGENGFVVSPRAPGEIAARVWELYQDRGFVARMRANAPEIVGSWNTGLAVCELQRLASSTFPRVPQR